VTTGSGAILRNCQLPALVTGNLSVPNVAGTIYSISGRTDVGQDQGANPQAPIAGAAQGILSIDPGVTIFGSGTLDFIVVNRGSRINATGTAADPIIFTARAGVQGQTNENSIGLWGGVVVLGRAPTSVGCPIGVTAPNVACTTQVEGTNAFYGGNSPGDSSGTMQFVRVQHSGFEILPNNELNGITFAGVGNGTVVENVQVHNSSDDGIENFGGTLNLRNIVLTGNDDDSFDVDTGWRGSVQYMLIVQRAGGGDRGFEFSSAGQRTPQPTPPLTNEGAFTLNTVPRMSNVTIVARNGGGDAIVVNSGNQLNLWNSVVIDPSPAPAACLDLDDVDTITAAPTFNSIYMSCPTAFRVDGDQDAGTAARFNAGMNNVGQGPSTLQPRNGSPFGFINGANENGRPVTAPVNRPGSFFLTTPSNIGAVHPGQLTWYQGWTCSPLIGEEAC
jgi:hypothetical protein